MQTVMSERLRLETATFRLACVCERCEHFVPEAEACDLLYPTAPHRQRAFESAADGEPVSFCKMFEAT
jgi:hypothetical protein